MARSVEEQVEFFKPEDFDEILGKVPGGFLSPLRDYDLNSGEGQMKLLEAMRLNATALANRKIQKWSIEVFSQEDLLTRNHWHQGERGTKDKFRALLISPQELPAFECRKHVPTTFSKTSPHVSHGIAADMLLGCRVTCLMCGVELEETGWKAKGKA